LASNPEAEVEVRGSRLRVRARIVEGDERLRLWDVMNKLYSGFEEYRERTERELRVFLLTPFGS
jgi:deazaflavin-dependent oxidoreductase (nitroreductase family)